MPIEQRMVPKHGLSKMLCEKRAREHGLTLDTVRIGESDLQDCIHDLTEIIKCAISVERDMLSMEYVVAVAKDADGWWRWTSEYING